MINKVSLFIPCFIDQLYPKVAQSTINVLQKLQCQVDYNPQQTCCGQPAFNAGYVSQAKAVFKKFIHDFATADYIVTPSASCCGFVRNYTKELVNNEISSKIFELSEFIVSVLKINHIETNFKGKIGYHTSCASLRETKSNTYTMEILSKLPNIELIEFNDSDLCCGFGGSFSVKFPEISTSLAQDKMNSLIQKNVEYLMSNDMSCLLHLQGVFDFEKVNIKTLHLAQILDC